MKAAVRFRDRKWGREDSLDMEGIIRGIRHKAESDAFPTGLFLAYICYYAGQAVYSTYLNLYLYQTGFSASQIGAVISVSTVAILAMQPMWGMLSDRVSVKNRVLMFLCLAAAACSMGFYTAKSYVAILLLVAAFGVFYNPIIPLSDNITLETLMRSRWDYGWIRMGGTIGYAAAVLVIGYFFRDSYEAMFLFIALSLVLVAVCFTAVPPVRGYKEKKGKFSLDILWKNKILMGLIGYHLIYGMGIGFFNSFYSIHFVDIGGDSRMVGWMMFASSAAEIPFLMLMNRIVKKAGIRKVLVLAGAVTCIRWMLMYVLTNPILIIGVNTLHGFGFSSFTYCILNYINNKVPPDLRASSQVLNTTLNTIFSRLIFGYIGGVAFELWGAASMMMFSSAAMGAATLIFWYWSRDKQKELSL